VKPLKFVITALHRIGRVLSTAARVLWYVAAIIFVLASLYCVRSVTMKTNDLVACGRYPTTYFYATLNWTHANFRLDRYQTTAFRVADPPHNFYIRDTGVSMAAAMPAAEFDAQKRSGWDALNLTNFYVAGRELGTQYRVSVPYFMPIVAGLSAAYVILRRPFKRSRRPGQCGKCQYDLRAHKPGDKCPECGTPIPSPAEVVR